MNMFNTRSLGLIALALGAALSVLSLILPGEFRTLTHDTQAYYCYDYFFQHGVNSQTPTAVSSRCGTYTDRYPIRPHHFLPREYPVLALIPFSLEPLTSFSDYRLAFEILMSVVFAVTCLMLFRERKSALVAFLIYSILGNITLALNRFDLIPALFVLLAFTAALRRRFVFSYLLLAVSVMLKLYSLPLVVPLFLAEQQTYRPGKFYRRFNGLVVFLAALAVAQTVAYLIDPAGAFGALTFFLHRPIQIGSLDASILWLLTFLGVKVCIFLSYGSINIASHSCNSQNYISMGIFDQLVTGASSLFFIGLLIKTISNQIKKRFDLAQTVVAVLLITLVTDKVFSPQYLLWITPLLALRYALSAKILIWWGGICLLTAVSYPFFYQLGYHSQAGTEALLAFVATRNCLLSIFTIQFIFNARRLHLLVRS